LKVDLPELKVIFASYWTLAAEAFRRIRTSKRGGMGHACEMETSIMLTLYPEQVRIEKFKNDGPIVRTAATAAFGVPDMLQSAPYYMVRNFDEISTTGTIGCPSEASVEKGALFLEAAVDAACALVTAFAAGELEFPECQER
jgi:creatinine amidohydrolase